MSSFDVESLFQSIDIILTQRLNALSYDTTVIATIVDDSDKDKGHYIVSDDTIKFDAYTTDATYKIGEQVRVTVINGDWSQKKFIEGKYSDKEADEKAVTYIPPLGTTLQSNLSQIGQKSKWTLQANGETYAKDPFVITIPEDSDLFNLQNKGIYDVLTIAADISTNLGNLSAGNYGLRLDLLITPESGSQYRIQKFITFDSSEMLGNPYNFIIDSHQEKRIAIADLGHVTEIVLTPYQGVVIADDGTETPAPFLDREGNAIEQLPIYFKNVVLGFGSDLAMLDDNSLKLYTPDLPFYDYNGSFGSSANHKRLGLIWCNKTETNEYIGFSDGIVDIDDDGNIVPYDEIEYLKASNFDERLVAQTNKVGIPSDKTSLALAANIADAVPLMKSAYENLTTGLSQVLQRFNGQIAGATSIQEKLKPLIFQYKDGDTQYPPKLVQFKDAAKEKATLLEELYTNILQYGYNTEKGLTPNDWNENWGNTDYYILFKSIISEALGEVAAFLNFAKEETATGKVLSGYRRIYNDYEPKINAQIKLINTYIDQIPIDADASTGDLAILKSYQTKTDYAPYVKEDFSEYANRYCIYWYHYNEGYKLEYIPPMSESEWNNNKTEHSDYQAYLDYCENNNIEYKYRNFLGDNWERLTIAYDLNEVDAVVNPRPLINFGLPNTVGETVAAVTYFPPAPAESQILTRWLDPCTVDEKYQAVLFYNHEMVKSNIVVFTNSEEVPPRFKVNAGDVLRVEHDIDSREHYQAYSSANDLLNISDGSKTRQLKCFYDGVLTGDETLADAEIYWYIPVNSTMLTYDKKFLVEKQGFSTDIDGKTPYSKDGYVYFNKKIGYTRTEEIMTDEDGKEMYDGNGIALRETVITIDSEDRFFFYKIKSFYDSSAQNNTILVYAYVPNKEEPTVGEINFTFGTFGSNGTKYTLAITPATDQIAVLPAADTGDDSGNLQLNLTLYNANSEKLDMTTGVGDSTGYYNLTAEWYASSTKAPALGEIKNIENSKSKSIEVLGVLDTNYDTNKYAGIIKASVSYQGAGVNEATDRVITLSALYSIPYASSEDLYISGPTSIIYNSQGTISRLSEEPYCLYQHTKNGDVKATIEKESENGPIIIEPEWSIKYYNGSGEEVSKLEIINYLPKLTPDNTLQPSPLYCDYGNEVYVPVVICTLDGNIVWTQPIIIIQNAYESSMLNDWDGSLQINKENGTIMATMVGAGVKNSDNTFSGVLMGDIVAGADFDSRNANGLGLYGFYHGDQSFNFSVDGTAFLGRAGRGRIIFDGNDGIIKSATTEDDSGMTIDLDDAWMEVRGPEKPTGRAMVKIDANPGNSGSYFSITSENNNKLIHIGQNNYYLKSDNYSNLGANDDIDNPDGSGMKIDLNRGRIDAYNFRLNSKNVLINSSDNASSYFTVKDNSGNCLMQVSSGRYYLQSSEYGYKTSDTGGSGMNIDLSTGRITAYNFELDAWTGKQGIYMNTNGSPYFMVGSSDNNLISLDNNEFKIRATNFILDALLTEEKNTETGNENPDMTKIQQSGIYISSEGNPWYLWVGNSEDNMISLAPGEQGLKINTNQFLLNAWTDEQGIYINSSPEGDDYFKIGSMKEENKNYIQLSPEKKLTIETNNFILKATNETGTITIETSSTDFPFKIEKTNGPYAKIGWDGILQANGAKLEELNVYKKLIVQKEGISGSSEVEIASTSPMLRANLGNKFYPVIFDDGTSGGTVSSGTVDIDVTDALTEINGITSIKGDTKIEGRLRITGDSEISGTTIMSGDVSLGDPTDNSKKVNLGITGNTEIKGNIKMGGNIDMQGNIIMRQKKKIYANDVGSDTYLEFDMYGPDKHDVHNTIAVSGYYFISQAQETWIGINKTNSKVFIGSSDGSYTKISGNLEVTANTKFPSPNNILIKDKPTDPKHDSVGDGYYTLPNYIKNNSKTLFSISWTDIDNSLIDINFGGTANAAKALTTDGKVLTLQAPASIGATNQILVCNDDLGTAKWGSLQVLTIQKTNKTVVISYDGTNSKTITLGDLAFANEVKKNLNITMTAALPSGYYTKTGKSSQSYYDYTISQGSRTVSGTANGTYVATGNEVAGEEYPVECSYSDTYSVDELSYDVITIEYDTFTPASGTVTMIGDSGEIAFGPASESGAVGTENININADSIAVP